MSNDSENSSLVVESAFSASQKVYQKILHAMKKYDFSEDEIFAVHLAFEEAFANAVRHGNKLHPHRSVQVDFYISNEKIEILVTDEGKGFDPERVPDPRQKQNLLQTSGRGLLLIRSYMDIAEYNNIGNQIRLVKFKNKCKEQKF